MTQRQRPIHTLPGMGRGLVNHDEASKAFPAVALCEERKPRTHAWRRGAAYDQGETPLCVGYTGKGILNSQQLSRAVPYRVRITYPPDTLYEGAKKSDAWPGDEYEGTSGLGLCRYLKSAGMIHEYRWCFGLYDVLLALSWVGPVGIGVGWHEGMRCPDSDGYIRATGEALGGHEVELTGIDVRRQRVVVTNSWGTGWGMQGRAFLSFDDLGTLLHEEGDAFVVVT